MTNSKHAFTLLRSSTTSSRVDALVIYRNLALSGITIELSSVSGKSKLEVVPKLTVWGPILALHDSMDTLVRPNLLS